MSTPTTDTRCHCGATSLVIMFPGNPKPVTAVNVKANGVTHFVDRCGIPKEAK